MKTIEKFSNHKPTIKRTTIKMSTTITRRRWRRKSIRASDEGGDMSSIFISKRTDEQQQQQEQNRLNLNSQQLQLNNSFSIKDARHLPSRLRNDDDDDCDEQNDECIKSNTLTSMSPEHKLNCCDARKNLNKSPRWTSIWTLIYHIVIISLILHKLDAHSSGALAAIQPQQQLRVNNVAAAAAASQLVTNGNNNEQLQRAEAEKVSFRKLAAAVACDCRDKTIVTPTTTTTTTNNDEQQQQFDAAAPRRQKRHLVASTFSAQPDFGSLVGRRSIQSTAPASTTTSNNNVDCQQLTALWTFLQSSYPALSAHLFQWASGVNSAKADDSPLSHHLDEAERLIARLQLDSATGRQQVPAWLARVSANPNYARIVQQLRARQHQQPPARWSRLTATSSVAPPSPPPPPPPSDDQVTYGRLVHYPHEIGNTENSNGMTRTLDKLRMLKDHARQQQEAERDIESNKIPTNAANTEWRDTSVDSARNNYVYGEVMYRPRGELEGAARPNPLATLRALASEQQRALAGGAKSTLMATPPASSSSSDTFGRILTSPPSSSRSHQDDNVHRHKQHHHHRHQQQQQQQQQQQHQGAFDETLDGGANSVPLGGDELINQQRSQQVAVSGELESNGESDEFEGEFHARPLQKPEVRLLRSLNNQNTAGGVEIVVTTSAPSS